MMTRRKKETNTSPRTPNVFVKFAQLPKDLRIKSMRDFMPLPELLRLSMTSKEQQQLLNEVISTAAKANSKFRVAGIDTFIHRGFDSAVFLKKKGINVPKSKIFPYSDKYYNRITENYTKSTQSCQDYMREFAAAELLSADLDDEAYADFWDEFMELATDRFPHLYMGYAFDANLNMVILHLEMPLLPGAVECCCTRGGACGEHCTCFNINQCVYMSHICDHFDFDEHHACYVLERGLCICHILHRGLHKLDTYIK